MLRELRLGRFDFGAPEDDVVMWFHAELGPALRDDSYTFSMPTGALGTLCDSNGNFFVQPFGRQVCWEQPSYFCLTFGGSAVDEMKFGGRSADDDV
jgi:hypothetical protein